MSSISNTIIMPKNIKPAILDHAINIFHLLMFFGIKTYNIFFSICAAKATRNYVVFFNIALTNPACSTID